MRKETPVAQQADAPPAADSPATSDAAAPDGAILFDPSHEWPSQGGCYVRQADGTLTREN